MNTIGSVYYGWAFLICCGGGSYYFAKRSINADRAERALAEQERRLKYNRQMAAAGGWNRPLPHDDHGAAAGHEDDHDPAPAAISERDDKNKREAVEMQRSKYESSAPFKSRKGDRFS